MPGTFGKILYYAAAARARVAGCCDDDGQLLEWMGRPQNKAALVAEAVELVANDSPGHWVGIPVRRGVAWALGALYDVELRHLAAQVSGSGPLVPPALTTAAAAARPALRPAPAPPAAPPPLKLFAGDEPAAGDPAA